MPDNTLQNIIFQHAIYGAGTILTGKSDIKAALIQPEELQAAIAHAKPLLQGNDYQASDHQASESSEYDLQQIVQLYNATVIDGRFIDDLASDPKSVAAKLGVELSDSAAAEIKQARTTVARRFGANFSVPLLPRPSPIVCVVIVIFIAIRAESKPYDVVIDSSGVIKL